MQSLARQMLRLGRPVLVGVDEVGRGCLAGPVVAAAVCLPVRGQEPPARDSKQLTAARREKLFRRLVDWGCVYGIGSRSAADIDSSNILSASLAAMSEALAGLRIAYDLVVVDGRQALPQLLSQYPLIRGDSLCLPVAAASIIAKVVRDRQMMQYDRLYPGYGFAAHKGYGTEAHRRALARLGPCPLHRLSFRGVGADGG